MKSFIFVAHCYPEILPDFFKWILPTSNTGQCIMKRGMDDIKAVAYIFSVQTVNTVLSIECA